MADSKQAESGMSTPRRRLRDAISQDKLASALLEGRGSTQLPEVPEFADHKTGTKRSDRSKLPIGFDRSGSKSSSETKLSEQSYTSRRHSRNLSGGSQPAISTTDYRELVRDVSQSVVGNILQQGMLSLTPRGDQRDVDYEKYRKKK